MNRLVGLYPLQRDKNIAKLFYVYSFIEPKHLEIPDGIITDSVLQHAITRKKRCVVKGNSNMNRDK